MTAVKVDGSGVTQPISAASLPLPSNAAQETGGNLASVKTNTDKLDITLSALRDAITAAGASAKTLADLYTVLGTLATASAQTTGNNSLTTIDTDLKATQPRSLYGLDHTGTNRQITTTSQGVVYVFNVPAARLPLPPPLPASALPASAPPARDTGGGVPVLVWALLAAAGIAALAGAARMVVLRRGSAPSAG
jgi:hypothetical protein